MDYCGENRAGNLFCLRMVDCESMPLDIRKGLTGEKQNQFRPVKKKYPQIPGRGANPLYNLATNNYRYAALNLASLAKFGSLEFRSMRCPVMEDARLDTQSLIRWVNLLLALKDKAVEYKTPIDIITKFSEMGPRAFAEDVFGNDLKYLRVHEDSLWEGLELVQDIAFAIDWEPVGKEVADKGTVPF